MTNDNCTGSGVAEIALGTRQARPLQVTVTFANSPPGGNALVTGSTRIAWRTAGEVAAFRVTFYDLSSGEAIWPVEGKPDGAIDEARDDVDPLDPMIIIRPARARVAAAVTQGVEK